MGLLMYRSPSPAPASARDALATDPSAAARSPIRRARRLSTTARNHPSATSTASAPSSLSRQHGPIASAGDAAPDPTASPTRRSSPALDRLHLLQIAHREREREAARRHSLRRRARERLEQQRARHAAEPGPGAAPDAAEAPADDDTFWNAPPPVNSAVAAAIPEAQARLSRQAVLLATAAARESPLRFELPRGPAAHPTAARSRRFAPAYRHKLEADPALRAANNGLAIDGHVSPPPAAAPRERRFDASGIARRGTLSNDYGVLIVPAPAGPAALAEPAAPQSPQRPGSTGLSGPLDAETARAIYEAWYDRHFADVGGPVPPTASSHALSPDEPETATREPPSPSRTPPRARSRSRSPGRPRDPPPLADNPHVDLDLPAQLRRERLRFQLAESRARQSQLSAEVEQIRNSRRAVGHPHPADPLYGRGAVARAAAAGLNLDPTRHVPGSTVAATTYDAPPPASAATGPTGAPAAGVVDGLGDRRRSPSPEEATWATLGAGVAPDARLPASAGASFASAASDSASEALSRALTRAPSRAASARASTGITTPSPPPPPAAAEPECDLPPDGGPARAGSASAAADEDDDECEVRATVDAFLRRRRAAATRAYNRSGGAATPPSPIRRDSGQRSTRGGSPRRADQPVTATATAVPTAESLRARLERRLAGTSLLPSIEAAEAAAAAAERGDVHAALALLEPSRDAEDAPGWLPPGFDFGRLGEMVGENLL